MLSSRIAALRHAAGLSQSQLAQMLHVGPSAVGMYEQGRRTPSIDILVEMAKQFNVSLDYLLTGSEFQNAPSSHAHPPDRPCCGCICKTKNCRR